MSSTSPGSRAQPYFLEKLPNLLCYCLYVPLESDEDSKVKEADIRGTNLPVKKSYRTSESVDPRVPALSMVKREEAKTIIRVHAPRMIDGVQKLVPYLDVTLDADVDLRRSTLRLSGVTKGDHLVGRLRFDRSSTGPNARLDRALLYPEPSELDPDMYASSGGVRCRQCCAQLIGPATVKRCLRATSTPWSSLIEYITCCPPEEYRGGKGDFAIGAEADGAHVVPSDPGSIIVGAASLTMHPRAILDDALDFGSPSQRLGRRVLQSRRDNGGGVDRAWTSVVCSACRSWIGEALCDTLCGIDIARVDVHSEALCIDVFKSRVIVARDDAPTYRDDSIIAATVLKTAAEKECQQFLLKSSDGASSFCLSLVNADVWVQSHDAPSLRPKVKVLFRTESSGDEDSETNAQWALVHGAEPLTLSPDVYSSTLSSLEASNARLPRSIRNSFGGFAVGYLDF